MERPRPHTHPIQQETKVKLEREAQEAKRHPIHDPSREMMARIWYDQKRVRLFTGK